ncbi:MAG: hypothetical protein K9J27_04825 [Bacteroidales bacterium]|nr:hypothetical protein [Bacteroidales bacterium]MCF8333154.1 hypothetical protein [Bacteroidales bacterium]
MKKIAILISVLLTTFITHEGLAQSETDALRYSRLYFGGSARSSAMGGAFGAIGADMSTMSTNPGGIGLYSHSQLSISPALNKGETESTYLGTTAIDSRYDFGMQNIGAVFTFTPGDDQSGWKKIQFGIGSNRLKNFNNQFQVLGKNTQKYGTIMEPYWNYATNGGGSNLQPNALERNAAFDAYLAYEADLLYDANTDQEGYQWGYDAIFGGVQQNKVTETSGAVDEVYITLGGNYNDRLYLGGTLGFQSIEYKQESTYKERDIADTIPYFNALTKYDDLKTTGSGVNLKLGAIYRAFQWLRVGVAYHTPTFYNNMQDEWSAQIESTLDLGDGPESSSSRTSKGRFDYKLRTPSRWIFSGAYIAGQYGLISVDYEIIDYSSANLDSDSDNFSTANNAIDQNFQRQHNIRVGTEWRYSNYYIRGGYSMYGSPSNINADEYGSTTFTTLGLGYKTNHFFLDVAYVHSEMKDTYFIYDANYAEPAENKYFKERFMTSIGFTF